jgi:hypothetical protein
MSNTTIADQFVEVLRQAGVERVYGVVGDSLNPSSTRSVAAVGFVRSTSATRRPALSRRPRRHN